MNDLFRVSFQWIISQVNWNKLLNTKLKESRQRQRSTETGCPGLLGGAHLDQLSDPPWEHATQHLLISFAIHKVQLIALPLALHIIGNKTIN